MYNNNEQVLFLQVSARYSRDPYNMLDQLKKMNLKHVKVKTYHKKSFKIFTLINSGCLWGEEERHSFEEVVKRN